MAFFVEKVLETEVGLVHVVSGIGRNLFMGASSSIGIAIKSFQASEECACAYVDRCRVIVRGGVGSKLAESEDNLLSLWGLHHRMMEPGRTGRRADPASA
jgi:hypothetical protein